MPPSLYPSSRWRALDVFRGLVVMGMILVNAADLGGHGYAWLQHANWDGYKLADSVFPSFLFIMGVAMGISLQGQSNAGLPLRALYPRILRRTLLLFALGLILNGCFAHGLRDLRVMGVLQRLSLCYFMAAMMLLHLTRRAQLIAASVLLLGYWWLLASVPAPQLADDASEIANNWPAYIDRALLGRAHLLGESPYLARIDPEGVLATLPAVVNVLFGAMAGRFLSRAPLRTKTSLLLGAVGTASCLAGIAFAPLFAINKALWTSSFVLVSSGVAALGLAVCYELVDVRGLQRLARPLEMLGLNAIAAYLLSTAIDAFVLRWPLQTSGGPSTLYDLWLASSRLAPHDAAFVFAMAHVALVWASMQAMQTRGWVLKI
jgi:predicted acyltransferase